MIWLVLYRNIQALRLIIGFRRQISNEELKFPFFRTGQAKAHYRVSLNVYDAILQIERRQEWLRNYLIQLEQEPLDFVGK